MSNRDNETTRTSGTVVGLFRNQADAERAIQRLKERGFSESQIGVAIKDRSKQEDLIQGTGYAGSGGRGHRGYRWWCAGRGHWAARGSGRPGHSRCRPHPRGRNAGLDPGGRRDRRGRWRSSGCPGRGWACPKRMPSTSSRGSGRVAPWSRFHPETAPKRPGPVSTRAAGTSAPWAPSGYPIRSAGKRPEWSVPATQTFRAEPRPGGATSGDTGMIPVTAGRSGVSRGSNTAR